MTEQKLEFNSFLSLQFTPPCLTPSQNFSSLSRNYRDSPSLMCRGSFSTMLRVPCSTKDQTHDSCMQNTCFKLSSDLPKHTYPMSSTFLPLNLNDIQSEEIINIQPGSCPLYIDRCRDIGWQGNSPRPGKQLKVVSNRSTAWPLCMPTLLRDDLIPKQHCIT